MSRFQWDRVPVLTTPRLELRALSPDDTPDLFTIYGDPEAMTFTSDPPFPDRSYVAQMLANVQRLFEQQQSIEWGIVLRAEQRIVGTCGFHTFEPESRRAEVGCLLGRHFWGQGIMHEALIRVIDFSFDRFDLHSLRADIDAPNVRSLALFRRLRFTPEAEGSTLLRLTRQDWERIERG